MPKISIILPVYNGQKYIEKTINMLCDTTLKDIEIIVIDDGSKDNSYAICCNCAKRDNRIKVYQKQNEGGVYAARNYGLKKVTGEYVCFCDQDDIVEPDIYEKMLFYSQSQDVDIVMCSVGKLIGEKRVTFETLPNIHYNTQKQISSLLLQNLFVNTSIYPGNGISIGNTIWRCMVKDSFIQENAIYFRRYVNYEDDWLFVLDCLARAKSVSMVSDILYYWRVNLKSETYTSKYIYDIYLKDKTLQDEIEKIMQIAGIDEKMVSVFRKHYSCVRYINILENEMKNDKNNLRSKIDYIKIIQTEAEYEGNLKMREKYNRNLVRKKIALWFLEKNQLFLAYIFLIVFNRLKLFGVRHEYWNRIERKLARIRK